MARTSKKAASSKTAGAIADGFINVPVSRGTRQGLHLLKESMGVASQAEVIEKLVAIGLAIEQASR